MMKTTGSDRVGRHAKWGASEAGSTMSLTDCESSGSIRHADRALRPKSEPIMEIIAREIASSLQKSAREDGDDVSWYSSGDPGDEIEDDGSLHALASMVVAAVDRKGLPDNAEEELLIILRKGLELGSTGSGKDEATERTESESSSRSSSFVSRSNKSSNSGSNNSGSTDSSTSKLSTYRHNAGAAIEYDWNAELNFDEDEDAAAAEDASNEDGEESIAYTEGNRSQFKHSQSLHDFVEKFPEISSSDSEDEVSLLSDVSGLTGVFSDFAEGHRNELNTKKTWYAPEAQLPVEQAPRATRRMKNSPKQQERVVPLHVRFSTVSVRMYERVMCEHPATSHGPSIGIDWEYKAQAHVSVAQWESKRRTKRRGKQMHLRRRDREAMIRELGYSEKDIATVLRGINKIKTQRRQTVNNLGAQKVEEMMENARRKVKRLLFLSREKAIRY